MKVVIVAGGTGGHLFPGIAVARALSGNEVLFVVRRGDLGVGVLEKEGFSVREMTGMGLPRSLSLSALAFPLKFLRGWLEARTLLREFKPDCVLGMGGYLSVPVILTAHWMGIKTILHEQNVLPGLSNRLLSRWADQVAVSFPASQPYFPEGKTWISGLPIRSDIGTLDKRMARKDLGLDSSLPTFLVFGGSLGARQLNSVVVEAWSLLIQKGLIYQVVHVTGVKDFERIENLYKSLNIKIKVLAFCHDMARVYAAADAVVCRAGASTVAELLAAKRPAFLVPYPYASGNHQAYNAEIIQRAGLGVMLDEKSLTPEGVADFLYRVTKDSPFKLAMEQAAAAVSLSLDARGAAARLSSHLTAEGNLL